MNNPRNGKKSEEKTKEQRKKDAEHHGNASGMERLPDGNDDGIRLNVCVPPPPTQELSECACVVRRLERLEDAVSSNRTSGDSLVHSSQSDAAISSCSRASDPRDGEYASGASEIYQEIPDKSKSASFKTRAVFANSREKGEVDVCLIKLKAYSQGESDETIDIDVRVLPTLNETSESTIVIMNNDDSKYYGRKLQTIISGFMSRIAESATATRRPEICVLIREEAEHLQVGVPKWVGTHKISSSQYIYLTRASCAKALYLKLKELEEEDDSDVRDKPKVRRSVAGLVVRGRTETEASCRPEGTAWCRSSQDLLGLLRFMFYADSTQALTDRIDLLSKVKYGAVFSSDVIDETLIAIIEYMRIMPMELFLLGKSAVNALYLRRDRPAYCVCGADREVLSRVTIGTKKMTVLTDHRCIFTQWLTKVGATGMAEATVSRDHQESVLFLRKTYKFDGIN